MFSKCLIFLALFASALSAKANELCEKINRQSVMVSVTEDGGGSGVVVNRGGKSFVLTCGHIFDENALEGVRVVLFDETKLEAEVIFWSGFNDYDMAILLLERAVPDGVVFREKKMSVGDEVYHIGTLHSKHYRNSLSAGLIAYVGRQTYGKVFDQTTVVVFPGSSGGGLFDKRDGKYIGMLTLWTSPNLNMMNPCRRIKKVLDANGFDWFFDETKEVKLPEGE